METTIKPKNPSQISDYYINRKRKMVDFLIGFFGFPILFWLDDIFHHYAWATAIAFIPDLLILVFIIMLFVLNPKRKFIGIGTGILIIIFVITWFVLYFL